MSNPYQMAVPKNGTSEICRARRLLEPMLAEHMEGFGDALEGHTAKDPMKRVRAHQLLRTATGVINMAKQVVESRLSQLSMMGGVSMEAALGVSTLQADITAFTTQVVHRSLDVFPRLIANRLCSIQPFTKPDGYVFFLERTAPDDSDRNLADLDTFDSSYANRAAEGDQVKTVGVTLSKQLVEVSYLALMHQHSHEVDVAMRTTYGLSLESLGDMTTADELAWEVDRQVVDAIVAFAGVNPLGTATFDTTAGGAYATMDPTEQKAYDRSFIDTTLGAVQIDMSAAIYRLPNWYLAGVNVAKLLARTPDVYAEKQAESGYFDQALASGSIISTGRMRDGAIVLMDPQLDEDTMIVGHTDNMNPFWAGYVFCPFGAAGILTAAFTDPDVLLTKKSRAIAYGSVGVNPKNYRKVTLTTS